MRRFVLTALLVLAVLALAGAARAEEGPSPQRMKAILADFDAYAQECLDAWGVPGMAVAVVRGEEIVFAKGYGVKRAGGKDPVTPGTIFQIGSNSKSFTASLEGMLVDQKQANWKDRVIDRLPDFRMYDPWVTREFTLEDLMEQHSGQPAYAADMQVFTGYGRDHVIQSLRYIEPVSSFRSEFAYVNNLWLVAAKIWEQEAGMSWEEGVGRKIFEPLGMKETSTGIEGFFGAPNHALPHDLVDGKIRVLDRDWPLTDWVYVYGPAGGINSNVLDMARYVAMHHAGGIFGGKRIFSEETARFLHSPKTPIPELFRKGVYVGTPFAQVPNAYCVGWVRTETRPQPFVWHTGGTTGMKSMMVFMPEGEFSVVILTNLGGNHIPEALVLRLLDDLAGKPRVDYKAKLLAAEQAEREKSLAEAPKAPAKPVASRDLGVLAGDYENPVFGRLQLRRNQDTLEGALGPRPLRMILRHWDGDSYDVSIPATGTGFGQGNLATFQVDADGSVLSVQFLAFHDAADGVFTRVAEGK